MRRTLVIGTAGHIDHGKSTLVRALTGIDPDRLKEEQARGITIELGFAHTVIDDIEVAFVDVPGHERFVRTMLAGAGGLDAVLLVLAADESVMPQTREHFEICRLLGIQSGIVVITKADLVDRDTVDLVELEARDLLEGSPLAEAPVVAVSAQTGEGLEALRQAIVSASRRAPSVTRRGVARLPIDRAFSIKGFGTVVTGTLVSGEVREGDALVVLPPGDPVRIRGVQVHGRPAAHVTAPRRTAVNLGGVDLDRVSRGMTLATPDGLAVTKRVDVRIELLAGARALRHGARIRVHQGTGEWLGRVSLSSVRAPGAREWVRVEVGAREVAIPGGGEALARIRLGSQAVLTRGDRLVLRAASPVATIGGAVVLDPEPAAGGIRRERAADRLIALTTSEAPAVVRIWLADAGLRGMGPQDFVRRGGFSLDDASRVLDGLVETGAAVRAPGVVLDAGRVAAAQASIEAMLRAFHRDQPEEAGLPREVVRDRIGAGGVFDTVLETMGGKVIGTERLALSAHRPLVSRDDERVRQALDAALQSAGYQPPDVAALAALAQVPPAVAQKALQGLAGQKRVCRLDVLWFHTATLEALKAEVKGLGAGASIDVAWAKARFGVSRKFAIPLLEYLDRERVTRRVGDRRLVI